MAWNDLAWPEDRKGWRAIADQSAYRELSYRDMAKKLGHGTNYYGTPRTMAMHTKVDTKTIELFQQRYFAAFPVIGNYGHTPGRHWHGWVHDQLMQYGFIETPYFKRRRYFYGRPEEDSTLREAIAYAPQSMTADEIDTGILNIWRNLPSVQLLIQVHDSILFQYPEKLEHEIVPQALNLLTIKMQLKKGREFYVPAEAKIGWNWADAHEDNPAGLTKWKGPGVDVRERPVRSQGNTLRAALNVRF
jgi:DNA polymerase I-like protein with 3'-5' exonuclease and polymerase domains